MKLVSGFFRWLLTMNTVWGLMIVSAFILTVYKHYTPEVNRIDQALFTEGANKLVINVFDQAEKLTPTEYTVERAGSDIRLAATQPQTTRTAELKSLVGAAGVVKAVWQTPGYGRYVVEVNGKPAAKGKLVTLQALTDAAFEYAKKAFELGLGLVSTMVLFLGLMKIAEESGLVKFVSDLMAPFTRFLFPEIPRDHPAMGAVLMNFTTGLLGLGNAATPFGLKAMMELQNLNAHKNVASNSMVILLAWNTAGFAILPTSLLAVRKAAGCTDPSQIFVPVWIGGLCATMAAIILAKTLAKLPIFSVEAALREEAASSGEAVADSTKTDSAETDSTDDKKKEA